MGDRLHAARGLIVLLALVVGWELASRGALVDPRLLPPASAVLARFAELWLSNAFPEHLAATAWRMALGYALAATVGIALGLLLGYWPGLYSRLEPLLELARPMPPVALMPPLMLFLGIGDEMKVALIFLGALWPILLNTVDGVRGVHPALVDAARMHRFGPRLLLTEVLLPAALPQLMPGLRVSLAVALILALVSEMVGATSGLGRFILLAQRSFRTADMYAGIVLLAAVGYALNRLFLLTEQRLIGHVRARASDAL